MHSHFFKYLPEETHSFNSTCRLEHRYILTYLIDSGKKAIICFMLSYLYKLPGWQYNLQVRWLLNRFYKMKLDRLSKMALRVKSERLKGQQAMVKKQVKRQEQHIAIDGLEIVWKRSQLPMFVLSKLFQRLSDTNFEIWLFTLPFIKGRFFFLSFSKSYIRILRAENAIHFVFDCFVALTVSAT